MPTALAHNEETLVIETPERVPLHFALASIGNRFLACAFDHTLQLVVLALVVIFFIWVGNAASYYEELKGAPIMRHRCRRGTCAHRRPNRRSISASFSST